MCGICGVFCDDPSSVVPLVHRMNDQLAHRGPDASGVDYVDQVAFGHRRLAIIDLSDAGKQPMWDTTGQYLITFNGEIYNYRELRRILEQHGAVFRTHSDTEVILEGYKYYGEGVFEHLNGMFALALWDRKQRQLLVARDRLGKKPLYYVERPEMFLFASELPALLSDSSLPSTLDEVALSHYLSLGYTLSSHCILRSVKKLQPGHYLRIRSGRPIVQQQYWDLAKVANGDRYQGSFEDAAAELKVLLDDAVRIRLESDVPLGAFLSGGIDSSTIVASMCAVRSAAQTLAFSVGFKEKEFDELEYAKAVADALQVRFNSGIVEPQIAESLPSLVWHCGEPFSDTSLLPTYLLSEHTRKDVTVSLSGDGADELFAGYETYVADKLQRIARVVPAPVLRGTRELYRRLVPRNFGKVSLDYKILQFLQGASSPFERAHYSWREIFSNEEKKHILKPTYRRLVTEADPFDAFAGFFNHVQSADWLTKALYVDVKTWLVDDILVKVDRMSMAHSLEVRCPFLDYRIVEFAARLPSSYRLRGFQKKAVLKRSQNARLSKQVLFRRKSGFNAPISYWMEHALSSSVQAMVKDSPLHEWLEGSYIAQLYADHLARRADNSFKLFTLIMLEQWTRQQRQDFRVAA